MNRSHGDGRFLNTQPTAGCFKPGNKTHNRGKVMYHDNTNQYFFFTNEQISVNLIKGRLPIRNSTRVLLSQKLAGIPKSDEYKKLKSESQMGVKNHRWGIKHTEESKKLMSESKKGKPKPKIICEHCKKEVMITNYIRWHGDKCKHKENI